MSLKVVLEDLREIGQGLWKTSADAELMVLIAPQAPRGGERHVILVSDPEFRGGSLEVGRESVQVVNVGDGSEVLVVSTRTPVGERTESGDEAFLQHLEDAPVVLRDAGNELLRLVRQDHEGWLENRNGSRRWVNRPDSVFEIRIQPRDKSLRVTIYGTPEDHSSAASSTLKLRGREKRRYSTFKVIHVSQVPEAVQVIRRAKKLKTSKVRPRSGSRQTKKRRQPAGMSPQGKELERLLRATYKPGDQFSPKDVYVFTDHFQRLYPGNAHIPAMLRSKLQELHDQRLVDRVRRGQYRLR